jgi:RNA polymerase sigma-70 factor, ECF subfamily
MARSVSFRAIIQHQGRPVSVSSDHSETLFEQFLSGDDEAFILLYREHHVRLHTYCLKILGVAAQADDITQEIWERVIRMRSDPPRLRNPAAFLVRMARNLCLDSLKSRRRHFALDLLPESSHPTVVPTDRSEREEIVLAALDKLSFDYREVLVLNHYCGYRFEEIATMLGKSPDAIWARASRARTRLRQLVLPALDELEAVKGGEIWGGRRESL